MIWIIIGLSVLSGVLYRLGGWGDEGRRQFPYAPTWLFNTKARDIGCTMCCTIGMVFVYPSAWFIHLSAFLILFASLTTYWDFM